MTMSLDLIDKDEYLGQPFDDVIHRLVNEVNEIKIMIIEEQNLRNCTPALQDVWEQYQTIKKLANDR